ncbi:DUF2894 domain-containing protein [Luteimonas sp. MJ250]|uniref:DUF2894 domain-containing protein n=1 Tax=Luteimonas sp. MJ250 TaxID=3129236 RepID=UPI0031BBCA7F
MPKAVHETGVWKWRRCRGRRKGRSRARRLRMGASDFRDSAALAPQDAEAAQVPESRAAASAPVAAMARPLPSLLDALERWPIERQASAGGIDLGLPEAAEWPALPALHEIRGLWARLRNQEQVRRALAPTPDDAGPLNSGALAGRMLRLMQAQSPDYLRQFTAYVGMLADLQDVQARAASAGGDAGRGGDASPASKRAKARRGRGAARPPADAG